MNKSEQRAVFQGVNVPDPFDFPRRRPFERSKFSPPRSSAAAGYPAPELHVERKPKSQVLLNGPAKHALKSIKVFDHSFRCRIRSRRKLTTKPLNPSDAFRGIGPLK